MKLDQLFTQYEQNQVVQPASKRRVREVVFAPPLWQRWPILSAAVVPLVIVLTVWVSLPGSRIPSAVASPYKDALLSTFIFDTDTTAVKYKHLDIYNGKKKRSEVHLWYVDEYTFRAEIHTEHRGEESSYRLYNGQDEFLCTHEMYPHYDSYSFTKTGKTMISSGCYEYDLSYYTDTPYLETLDGFNLPNSEDMPNAAPLQHIDGSAIIQDLLDNIATLPEPQLVKRIERGEETIHHVRYTPEQLGHKYGVVYLLDSYGKYFDHETGEPTVGIELWIDMKNKVAQKYRYYSIDRDGTYVNEGEITIHEQTIVDEDPATFFSKESWQEYHDLDVPDDGLHITTQ